jgi:hypothetical protein
MIIIKKCFAGLEATKFSPKESSSVGHIIFLNLRNGSAPALSGKMDAMDMSAMGNKRAFDPPHDICNPHALTVVGRDQNTPVI